MTLPNVIFQLIWIINLSSLLLLVNPDFLTPMILTSSFLACVLDLWVESYSVGVFPWKYLSMTVRRLHLAAWAGQMEVVIYLCKHKADTGAAANG